MMKLTINIIKIFIPTLIISMGFGQDVVINFRDNGDGTFNVDYINSTENELASFQFNVDAATVDSAYGGAYIDYAFNFTISTDSSIVSGSNTGESISAWTVGTLVVLKLNGIPTGLSGIVISDPSGNIINHVYYFKGCDDANACNYNEIANYTHTEGCLFPCSTPNGCVDIDNIYDCNGNCIVGVDCAGVCGGPITDDVSCTGCMDDGYQQWSPNQGSPACNYAPFAIIEGDCQYNDCNGDCGGTANKDCSGSCLEQNDTSWDSSCEDCDGIQNGSAYENACGVCVGGNTGNPDDCFILEKESNSLYYSDSVYTIQVFAENLDTLQSIDIEFQYDENLLEMTGFSLYGTALGNQGYEIAYFNTIVEEPNLMETKLTIYFNPHNSTDYPMVFSPDGRENIFDIQLETKFILTESETTEIKINTLNLNENPIFLGDWGEWTIFLRPLMGCTDDLGACNYNSSAIIDDGSCWTPIDGCACSDGEGAVVDVCDVCNGTDTDIEDCNCLEGENIQYDCNGDCPPDECPGEFSFVKGCAFRDECNVCVGGATERYPCTQDCTGEWGGYAYEDNCDQCIAKLDDIDCFSASFIIYNSTGTEIENSTIIETEEIIVALSMQNLPDSLEGIILNLEYDPNILSLNTLSFNPSGLETEGGLTGMFNNSDTLFHYVNDGIITAIIYATNEPYQGNSGNLLFLEFATLGTNGDSTILNYNQFQINEHVMQEQNYTSQVIYIGDCIGIFNGETPPDDCGVCGGGNADMDDCGICFGPGPIYECGCENIPEGACDCEGNGIPEGACDCDGNTPAELYGGEGYNCEGELSLNNSLIPRNFALSQNYPNPFNPITYIQYSVPQFDFVTIEIININGQKIKTIVEKSLQPGNYEISWNGANYSGFSVPSGIYFYKMNASNFISVRKLVLLK